MIVGAGMAGLTAAQALAPAFDVVVVDKGRGVGGRLATRRIGDATFDHGAQFLTTHSPEFAATVAGWERAGVAEPWFHGRVGPDGIGDRDGHVRYRGVGTMNAIAKHVADGLEVRLGARVSALSPSTDRWSLHLDDGTAIDAEAVVLTAPVPQTLDLLAAGSVSLAASDLTALEAIRYDPCLAALVVLDGPSGLPEPGAVGPASGPIDWMADNQRKGVSRVPAVTIHATADFSRRRWDADDAEIVADVLRAAGLASGAVEGQAQVQRWRYARPVTVHPDGCLVAAGLPPLVFAGDAFGGAKVEGAARSGAAAAEALSGVAATDRFDR